MARKKIILELTAAEARQLLQFALEGECEAEDRVNDGVLATSSFRAGARATTRLALALDDFEGR